MILCLMFCLYNQVLFILFSTSFRCLKMAKIFMNQNNKAFFCIETILLQACVGSSVKLPYTRFFYFYSYFINLDTIYTYFYSIKRRSVCSYYNVSLKAGRIWTAVISHFPLMK